MRRNLGWPSPCISTTDAASVTNSGAREVAGFDLKISGLPDGVTVNNASGRDGNDWIIHHRQPLAAGASVKLLIEYYTPVRGTVLNPQVTVGLVTEPEGHPDAPAGGLDLHPFRRTGARVPPLHGPPS